MIYKLLTLGFLFTISSCFWASGEETQSTIIDNDNTSYFTYEVLLNTIQSDSIVLYFTNNSDTLHSLHEPVMKNSEKHLSTVPIDGFENAVVTTTVFYNGLVTAKALETIKPQTMGVYTVSPDVPPVGFTIGSDTTIYVSDLINITTNVDDDSPTLLYSFSFKVQDTLSDTRSYRYSEPGDYSVVGRVFDGYFEVFDTITVNVKSIQRAEPQVSSSALSNVIIGEVSSGVGALSSSSYTGVNESSSESIAFMVYFDSQEGSVIDSQSIVYNNKVNSPVTAPTKYGHVFKGWYLEPYVLTLWDFTTGVITNDVTLYAKWEELPKYIVSFHGNTHEGGVVPLAPAQYYADTKVAVPDNSNNFFKTNYTFSGWNTDSTGVGLAYSGMGNNSLVMPHNDLILYAQWVLNSYPIVIKSSIDSSTIDSVQLSHMQNFQISTFPEVPIDYQFTHWYQSNPENCSIDDSLSMTPSINCTGETVIYVNIQYYKGTFVDSRDSKEYGWVRVGEQIWMTDNLMYDSEDVSCYNDSLINCEKYGGLYDLGEVLNGQDTSSTNPSGVQGICPNSWHVPSESEWDELNEFIGISQGTDSIAQYVRSSDYWDMTGNSDLYELDFRPTGYFDGGTNERFEVIDSTGQSSYKLAHPPEYVHFGSIGGWWVSNLPEGQWVIGSCCNRSSLYKSHHRFVVTTSFTPRKYSLRCVKD
ncbi:MAG: InlB B-repeat-containing protein [Fibrobacterales bacterium]